MKPDISFKLVSVVVLAGVVLAFSPLANAHRSHRRHLHSPASATHAPSVSK